MMIGNFDIPTAYFFEEKNVWTGSREQKFNYKIQPIDGKLVVSVWYGLLCFDKVKEQEGIKTVQEFELSKEGTEQVSNWLEDEFQTYKSSLKQ